ncbi:hypothetical protein D3C87_2146700 [compost metagenome]
MALHFRRGRVHAEELGAQAVTGAAVLQLQGSRCLVQFDGAGNVHGTQPQVLSGKLPALLGVA